MSHNPKERTEDSKKVAENDLNKQGAPPLDKQDPTQPVEVGGSQAKNVKPDAVGSSSNVSL
jgi:hypothetical protein